MIIQAGLTDSLRFASALAAHMHSGQVDKAGEDYFDGHLTRVADAVTGSTAKTVAYLHDILEDTPMTAESLCAMFDEDIVLAVQMLTRREGVTYMDHVRILAAPLGTARKAALLAYMVKKADVRDHLRDTTHIPDSLAKRYRKALAILEGRA